MKNLSLKPLGDKKLSTEDDEPNFEGIDNEVNEIDKNFTNCHEFLQPSTETSGSNNNEKKIQQAITETPMHKNETKNAVKLNAESEMMKKKFKSNYYARRLSTIGVMTSKNIDSSVNISTMRRKYSLDSKLTSASLLPSRQPRHSSFAASSSKVGSSLSFSKSPQQRSSFNADSKENFDILQHMTHSSLFSPRSRLVGDSDTMSFQPPSSSITKTNSVLVSQTNRSGMSSSSLTANSNGDDAANKATTASRMGTNRLFRNSKTAKVSSSNLEGGAGGSPTRQRVSFGQIELKQLDIPTVYKYSNVGFEKHKLNPNFYLPDGSLKRKFSLPKLTDTIETIKNCRYLRRNSLDEDKSPSHVDVVNIFKDLNPTPNEIRNFDFVHEDTLVEYLRNANA